MLNAILAFVSSAFRSPLHRALALARSMVMDARATLMAAKRRYRQRVAFEMSMNNRGAMSARGIALVVVAAAVAAILIQVILIPFVDDLAGANTSNLSGNQNTMVELLPTVILLVPVLVLIFAALAEAR